MPYNPQRHRRRSIRLPGYDYTCSAAYFLTLCTAGRACLFGAVAGGAMRLNALGRVVEDEWRRAAHLRAEVVLDAFVVMPNHLHGIVVITSPEVGAAIHRPDPSGYRVFPMGMSGRGTSGRGRPAGHPNRPGPAPRSVAALVAGFKSAATRRINDLRATPGMKIWQRNYWERILWDEREWRAVRRYIKENPARWERDRNNRP